MEEGTVQWNEEEVPVMCLIMEEGEVDLRKEQLTAKEYVDCANDIIRALIYLHGDTALHRDIKPENIMTRKDRSFMFIDFGFAREFDEFQTMNSMVYTEEFAHPVLKQKAV